MSKPVALDWYETIPFTDGVTLIREKHVAPWLRCNIWHVKGRDSDLIVDTGMGLRPLTAEIAALTERPLSAVMTHSHFDHAGGLHQFSHRCGHALEADIIKSPTEQNTVADIGYVIAETFTALPYAGFKHTDYTVKPAPLTRVIEDGDVFDLGDRVFKVMHLPGHSPGSIALYEGASETLFSGDVLYDGELLDELYHSDKTIYRESLARLKELPLRTVHAGHFKSFDRPRLINLVDTYLAI
ncbi:MAG: MBL fold metallo-hydrolase [Aliishimia sp.]